MLSGLMCHTLYPTPHLVVTCPTGSRYGSKCSFSCEDSFELKGETNTKCGKVGGKTPRALWDFGSVMPKCQGKCF